MIPNINCEIDKRKSFFTMNDSWESSIHSLVFNLDAHHDMKILINGVANIGKSTFATALINSVKSQFDVDVYILDIDPGQPNYNLAG